MSLIVVYLPRMTAAMRVCVCTVGYLSHSQIAFEINEAIDRELSVSVSEDRSHRNDIGAEDPPTADLREGRGHGDEKGEEEEYK